MKNISLKKYEIGSLKCVFEKDDFNDISVINIFYPVNMECERQNKGIGSFTTKMMLKGTKNLSVHEFALELEKNAIVLNVNRTNSYINFSLAFDNEKDVFHKAIDLFLDVLENPRFEQIEIEKLKNEFLNAIFSRFDDISTACSDEFLRLIYGEENYKSWCNLGTKESIKSLSKQELENFHKTYILENTPTVSVIGNFENFKEIEDYFLNKILSLSNGKKIENVNIDAKFVTKPTEKDITKKLKKNFNQAYIMSGILMPSISDENFVSLKLINNYLGYGMSSVFFDRIREEMGLVYEIGSLTSSYNSENFWTVYLGLDKKNVDLALNAIDEELKNFCINKISQEKLDILKAKTKRYEIFKQQKKSSRCFYLGLSEILGLGYDYRDKYLKKIDEISLAEMNKAIDVLFKDKPKSTAILI